MNIIIFSYYIMNANSIINAERLNNPNKSDYITTMIESIKQILNIRVGSLTNTENYSYFNDTNLSRGNLENNKLFNNIIRDEIQAPIQTSPDFQSGLNWVWFYFSNILLNATFYQVPWYEIQFNAMFLYGGTTNYTSNYAVRLNEFNNNDYNEIVYTIINVMTGNEEYRVVFGYDDTFLNRSGHFLRNTKKVNNGVVDDNTILGFGDMLKIASCIPTDIEGYKPYDDYNKTIHTSASGKVIIDTNEANIAKSLVQFMKDSGQFTMRDGINSHIVLKAPRLIAVDKGVSQTPNYIFSWSFLPWNDNKYNIYDAVNMAYIGINPICEDNFLTIIKLILLGLFSYEIITLFINGKLKF